ncbi:MAG: hypothetical protein QOF90_212, partial [Acetobacteraceae bacterium]|nr:hypothetical protein [Acetobacteraceae bacterium]
DMLLRGSAEVTTRNIPMSIGYSGRPTPQISKIG